MRSGDLGSTNASGIDDLIAKAAHSPLALANLAKSLVSSPEQNGRARAMCAQARAQARGDGEILAICAEVESTDVPQFYSMMVHDRRRHQSFAQALGAALAKGGEVLDIGAGTGLFAMMAARAGATRVYACERNSAVAAAAQAVVNANGLEDLVGIVAKSSADVRIGIDIDAPVDLILWDILSNDLLGAGALPVMEDAVNRLLAPGGAVMPARARIKAALAEHSNLSQYRFAQTDGFDLTPLNRLTRPQYTIACRDPDLKLRSQPVTLFEFDFGSGGPYAAERVQLETVGTGGSANGIVQWLEFDFDESNQYSSSPGLDVQAFGLEFHPSPTPWDATLNQTFEIGASHDRLFLRIWLVESAVEAAPP